MQPIRQTDLPWQRCGGVGTGTTLQWGASCLALWGPRRKDRQSCQTNVPRINLSICLRFSRGPPRTVNEAHAPPREQS